MQICTGSASAATRTTPFALLGRDKPSVQNLTAACTARSVPPCESVSRKSAWARIMAGCGEHGKTSALPRISL